MKLIISSKSDASAPTRASVDMEKGGRDKPRPSGPPGSPPGPPGGWLITKMSKQQEILFNIMVAFLQLIPQSTLTTVFPVSRDTAKSFSISNLSTLPWLVAAYALSFGTFILIGGRLGDIFGHKTMVVIGYSFLSFWSVVAGLSHYAGYYLFFVARGFQGVGASLMVPNGLALLGRTYPPGSKQKVFAFTLFGLCAPIGAYLGMLFGALFEKYATWWWSFYTLAIVSAFLAVGATVILVSPPATPKQMLPVREKLRDMDWLGSITGVSGLVCIQVSLVSAPASGWSTQYIFMLLIIGLLLLAFFVVTELKIAEQPLVPFKMLKADVGFVLGAVFCGWAAFGVWTWFLWKFLLGIKRDAPLEAAVRVLPIVPVALIASILTAWMMRKCQPSWTLFWALVAFTFGPLLLAIDSNIDKTVYWSWTFASLVVMPFGMDMSFPAATLIMSNFFPPQQQGIAGSLISTTVNYSISIGLGLASTVEVHVSDHGRNVLTGIRGGWWMGVGLGSLGVLICVAFVLKSILHPAPSAPKEPSAGPDPAMQMTAQGPPPAQERKPSQAATISSMATTTLPDTASALTTKRQDVEPFRSCDFDTKSAPLSTSTTALSSPRKQSSAANKGHRNAKDSQPRNESIDFSHSRSDSRTHLTSRSPQAPICSPPPIRLPLEPDPVHRTCGSFESDHGVAQRDRPFEHGSAYGSGSGPRSRDPDGFGYEMRPVIPRGMMGDRF